MTRTIDERGRALASAVVAVGSCAWCEGPMPIRAKGRPPKFCRVECRKALHAAERRLAAAVANLRHAEAQVSAARRDLSGRSAGDMFRLPR